MKIKKSKYYHVSWSNGMRKWRSSICKKRLQIVLGYYESELEAALRSDAEYIKEFGYKFRLNFPPLEPEITIPDTRWIRLNKGMFVLVDACNYDWLNQYHWFAWKKQNTYYAARTELINGKSVRIYMHRQILGVIDRSIKVDHRNHDGLNDTILNIRKCNDSENSMNQLISTRNTSGYKGVFWHKTMRKWYVIIGVKGKSIYLGSFREENKEQAAECYDFWAAYFYKEFAWFNFKTGIIDMLN